jgi:hypothetical protein
MLSSVEAVASTSGNPTHRTARRERSCELTTRPLPDVTEGKRVGGNVLEEDLGRGGDRFRDRLEVVAERRR